jgi:hypothetical protein
MLSLYKEKFMTNLNQQLLILEKYYG